MSAGKTCEDASVCSEMILFLCTPCPLFINVSYGLNDLDIKMQIYLMELFLYHVKHKKLIVWIQLDFVTFIFSVKNNKKLNKQ